MKRESAAEAKRKNQLRVKGEKEENGAPPGTRCWHEPEKKDVDPQRKSDWRWRATETLANSSTLWPDIGLERTCQLSLRGNRRRETILPGGG